MDQNDLLNNGPSDVYQNYAVNTNGEVWVQRSVLEVSQRKPSSDYKYVDLSENVY